MAQSVIFPGLMRELYAKDSISSSPIPGVPSFLMLMGVLISIDGLSLSCFYKAMTVTAARVPRIVAFSEEQRACNSLNLGGFIVWLRMWLCLFITDAGLMVRDRA